MPDRGAARSTPDRWPNPCPRPPRAGASPCSGRGEPSPWLVALGVPPGPNLGDLAPSASGVPRGLVYRLPASLWLFALGAPPGRSLGDPPPLSGLARVLGAGPP